jgi:hypothetical protein
MERRGWRRQRSVRPWSCRKWSAALTFDGEETLEKGGVSQATERSKIGGGAHLRWGGDAGDKSVWSGPGAVDNGRRRSPSMGRRHCRQEGLGQLPSDRQRAAALTFDGEERLETGGLGQAPESSKIGAGAHLRWGDDAGVGRGSVSSPSDRKRTAGLTFDEEEILKKAGLCQAPELSKIGAGAHLRWGGDAGHGWGLVSSPSDRKLAAGLTFDRGEAGDGRGSVRPRGGPQRVSGLTFDGGVRRVAAGDGRGSVSSPSDRERTLRLTLDGPVTLE